MSDQLKSVALRFVKAFLAGGASSVVLALAQAPSLNTLADLKTWLLALGMAFLTGGVLAVEKAVNWTPAQTNS